MDELGLWPIGRPSTGQESERDEYAKREAEEPGHRPWRQVANEVKHSPSLRPWYDYTTDARATHGTYFVGLKRPGGRGELAIDGTKGEVDGDASLTLALYAADDPRHRVDELEVQCFSREPATVRTIERRPDAKPYYRAIVYLGPMTHEQANALRAYADEIDARLAMGGQGSRI